MNPLLSVFGCGPMRESWRKFLTSPVRARPWTVATHDRHFRLDVVWQSDSPWNNDVAGTAPLRRRYAHRERQNCRDRIDRSGK